MRKDFFVKNIKVCMIVKNMKDIFVFYIYISNRYCFIFIVNYLGWKLFFFYIFKWKYKVFYICDCLKGIVVCVICIVYNLNIGVNFYY